MGIGKKTMPQTFERPDSTTIIAEGSKHTGEFSGAGNYVVFGEVEGNCDIEGSLKLEPSARWVGKIKAHEVVIAGTAEGEIEAASKIEVATTAHVNGSLNSAVIAVAEGADIKGALNMQGKITRPMQAKDAGNDKIQFIEKRPGDVAGRN